MSRAVLMECAPWAAWMAGAFVLLWVLVRISGARWNFSRLKAIHSCQQGGTQTVSFVLTLPVFIMVVLFIVQVSQLMIAVTVVHYAAFAAARAGIVWFPAALNGIKISHGPNMPGQNAIYTGKTYVIPAGPHLGVATKYKERKVWMAAMFACMPISPSRKIYNHNLSIPDDSLAEEERLLQLQYAAQVPSSSNNKQIATRITNKLRYADRATEVWITGLDIDSQDGPTYTPWDYTKNPVRDDNGAIGWEDPLTFRVNYKLSLLPGVGRLFIKPLVKQDGQEDRVSELIRNQTIQQGGPSGDEITETVTIKLTAAVTMTNEGLKSVFPYVDEAN